MSLGLQLFATGRRSKGAKFVPVKNDRGVKPLGGLWTSTYTPEADHPSGWIAWCASEMPEWIPETGIIYRVLPAKILRVDCLADLDDIFADWGTIDRTYGSAREYIDFERLAKSYDAMHLTEEGQWRTRTTRPHDLYGWDCESTLWFRMDVLEAVKEISLKGSPAEQPQSEVVAG